MLISEVLDSAADLIEKDGWVQRKVGGPGIGWCVVGAVTEANRIASGGRHAALYTTSFWAPLGFLACRLGELDHRAPELPIWNDDPERTEQQVLDALRRCAKQARITEERA